MIKVRRGLTQTAGFHRHRFRPSEWGNKSKRKQRTGNHHRAERINMAQRIQAQAAEQLRRTVAEIARGPAVRDLMQGNGK